MKSTHYNRPVDARYLVALLVLLAISALACASSARYVASDAAGNQCENQCVAIYRTCENTGGAGNQACRNDLDRCRRNCFDYHGGTFTPSGTSQTPITKPSPSSHNETQQQKSSSENTTSQESAGGKSETEKRLEHLRLLHLQGTITDEEYEAKRREIIDAL